MNNKLMELLSLSKRNVRYSIGTGRYEIGNDPHHIDGYVDMGRENWYLGVRALTNPEIFKINGWEENYPFCKISIPVADKKRALEQIKNMLRYISVCGQC